MKGHPAMTLQPPERFERREVTGYFTDRISIGKNDTKVAVVLSNPDDPDHTLIFQTSPSGARQVAASLLNQADDLDDGPPKRHE